MCLCLLKFPLELDLYEHASHLNIFNRHLRRACVNEKRKKNVEFNSTRRYPTAVTLWTHCERTNENVCRYQ